MLLLLVVLWILLLVLLSRCFSTWVFLRAQVCAVGTVNDDPQAVAAMELFRSGLMPSQDVVESAEGRFNLVEYLSKQQQQQ